MIDYEAKKLIAVKIELLAEFAVILLAPIIHSFYLWKYKKVEREVLVKNIKIFTGLYVLLGIVGVLVVLN